MFSVPLPVTPALLLFFLMVLQSHSWRVCSNLKKFAAKHTKGEQNTTSFNWVELPCQQPYEKQFIFVPLAQRSHTTGFDIKSNIHTRVPRGGGHTRNQIKSKHIWQKIKEVKYIFIGDPWHFECQMWGSSSLWQITTSLQNRRPQTVTSLWACTPQAENYQDPQAT